MKTTDYIIIAAAIYWGIAGYSHGAFNAFMCFTFPIGFYLLGTVRQEQTKH